VSSAEDDVVQMMINTLSTNKIVTGWMNRPVQGIEGTGKYSTIQRCAEAENNDRARRGFDDFASNYSDTDRQEKECSQRFARLDPCSST